MLFRDVDNESGNEIHSRNAFFYRFVILVASVVKGNHFPIVFINAGGGNNRSAQITADIFDSDIRSTEIWLGSDIEAFRMMVVNIIFDSIERRTEAKSHLRKKNLSESIAKEVVVEMLERSPWCEVTCTTFRNEGMDMRIPFEIATEGMKYAEEAGSEQFGLVGFMEHTRDDITNRGKQKVEKRTVLEKEDTELFRNGKDTVSVNAGNQLAGHVKGTNPVVLVATGRAKATVTAKKNKLEVATMGAAIHGTTLRRGTTRNHLADIFHDSRTRMKFVADVFEVISKNGL